MNAKLTEAAIYNTTKSTGARVLAGYYAVNQGGHVIRIPARGIRAVGDEVVGLKPGLRLATRADFDPHGHAAEQERIAVAAQDRAAQKKIDDAEYAAQLAALPASAPQKKGA